MTNLKPIVFDLSLIQTSDIGVCSRFNPVTQEIEFTSCVFLRFNNLLYAFHIDNFGIAILTRLSFWKDFWNHTVAVFRSPSITASESQIMEHLGCKYTPTKIHKKTRKRFLFIPYTKTTTTSSFDRNITHIALRLNGVDFNYLPPAKELTEILIRRKFTLITKKQSNGI